MKLKVTTQSGSTYLLDKETMTWKRENPDTKIRTEEGTLLAWPDPKKGKGMNLFCPGLLFGTRLIYTSDVTSIEEVK